MGGCDPTPMSVQINTVISFVLEVVCILFFVTGKMQVETCVTLSSMNQEVCRKQDVDSSDVTFGFDSWDGSTPCVVAFVCATMAASLCAGGVGMAFKKKWKQVQCVSRIIPQRFVL
jgi:hypothetical protein